MLCSLRRAYRACCHILLCKALTREEAALAVITFATNKNAVPTTVPTTSPVEIGFGNVIAVLLKAIERQG
jgi:hypothetical protein